MLYTADQIWDISSSGFRPLTSNEKLLFPSFRTIADGLTKISAIAAAFDSIKFTYGWTPYPTYTVETLLTYGNDNIYILGAGVINPGVRMLFFGIETFIKRKQSYHVAKKDSPSLPLCTYPETGYTKIKSFRRFVP